MGVALAETLSPAKLISPRRLDLAVKWRFFRHLSGGNDPDSLRVYRWHIEMRSGARINAGVSTDRWKRSLDDYVNSAKDLFASMLTHGFLSEHPVPVDPYGDILDGSHRVACALALGLRQLTVEHHGQYAWAPPWDFMWFVEAGMNDDDLDRLMADWTSLHSPDP